MLPLHSTQDTNFAFTLQFLLSEELTGAVLPWLSWHGVACEVLQSWCCLEAGWVGAAPLSLWSWQPQGPSGCRSSGLCLLLVPESYFCWSLQEQLPSIKARRTQNFIDHTLNISAVLPLLLPAASFYFLQSQPSAFLLVHLDRSCCIPGTCRRPGVSTHVRNTTTSWIPSFPLLIIWLVFLFRTVWILVAVCATGRRITGIFCSFWARSYRRWKCKSLCALMFSVRAQKSTSCWWCSPRPLV